MPKLLYTRDSTEKCLNAVRRHISLCNQIPGAARYAQAIKPKLIDLLEKSQAVRAAVDNRLYAYDQLVLHDCAVDNSIRTGFAKCEQFEREHPNEPVILKIFPDRKFGSIIYENRQKELIRIEQLIVRFESLGEKNPLYAVAEDLKNNMDALRKSTAAFNETVRLEKIAIAEEDIARVELCRAYESNYLDARKEVSHAFANSLFPRIVNTKTVPEPVPEQPASLAA